jgi:hypothetical protein
MKAPRAASLVSFVVSQSEVSHDNRLLNDAMQFGEETDAQTYKQRKPEA